MSASLILRAELKRLPKNLRNAFILIFRNSVLKYGLSLLLCFWHPFRFCLQDRCLPRLARPQPCNAQLDAQMREGGWERLLNLSAL